MNLHFFPDTRFESFRTRFDIGWPTFLLNTPDNLDPPDFAGGLCWWSWWELSWDAVAWPWWFSARPKYLSGWGVVPGPKSLWFSWFNDAEDADHWLAESTEFDRAGGLREIRADTDRPSFDNMEFLLGFAAGPWWPGVCWWAEFDPDDPNFPATLALNDLSNPDFAGPEAFPWSWGWTEAASPWPFWEWPESWWPVVVRCSGLRLKEESVDDTELDLRCSDFRLKEGVLGMEFTECMDAESVCFDNASAWDLFYFE